MQSPYHFFYANAGYSYDPQTETKQRGRTRCAKAMANAERYAQNVGMKIDWSIDGQIDSSDFDESPEPWSLWQCVARDAAGNIVASLHGIDFGRDNEPWGNPYKRVVEAELASEVMGRIVDQYAKVCEVTQ